MVDKRKKIITIVALLLIAGGIWWVLREKSPKEQIKAQLNELCDLVSKNAEAKNTQLGIKNHLLQGIFADPIEIAGDAGPATGLHTPSELASLVTHAQASVKSFKLTYTDLTIDIQSPEKAAISFTGKLQVTMKDGGDGGTNFREVAGKLRNVKGEWLFYYFKVVNVMKGQ